MNKSIFIVVGLLVLCSFGVFFSMRENTERPTQQLSLAKTHMENIPGLTIDILNDGSGEGAKSGQTVIVDYTGMLTDGTVFDSSIPRGEPFPVHLGKGEVIKGWDLGLVGMRVGEKRKLTISPELGYGKSGFPGVIPPNATLVFEVTLKAIQ